MLKHLSFLVKGPGRRFKCSDRTRLILLLTTLLCVSSGYGVRDVDAQQDIALVLEMKTTIEGSGVAFGQIGGIVSDSHGRIYVTDVQAQEILVINAEGELIDRIGRRGEGPGDFLELVPTLAFMGDTLLVMNGGVWRGSRKVVFFELDGEVVLERQIPHDEGFFAAENVLLIGGAVPYLLEVVRPPPQPVDPGRPFEPLLGETRYHRFGSDGSVIRLPDLSDDVEATGSGAEGGSIRCRNAKWLPGLTPPFRDRGPLRAFTPLGQLVKAYKNDYRIDVIDSFSNQVIRSIRRDVEPIPLEDEEWERLPEVQELRYFERDGGKLELRGAPGTPCPLYTMRPEFHPVIRTIVTDEAGRFWVEVTAEKGFALHLLESDGTLVGEVAMPDRDPGVTPYVRDNRIYLVTIDEFDVQGIEVYEVLPIR